MATTYAQQSVQTVAHAPNRLAGYYYKEVVENADSTTAGLPLVIALHWMGSTPDRFAPYIRGFKQPVRLLLVEAPYSYKQGFTFYSLSPQNYYDLPADQKMAVLLAEANKLSKFIEAATKRYAPRTKPVIIGASQGGDLSYVIGIRFSHLVSQSCPLLATMDNRIVTSAKKPNQPVPIDAYHGTADPIVPMATVQQHIQVLKDNGYPASLHTYEGIKHDIPDAMKADYIELISRKMTTP